MRAIALIIVLIGTITEAYKPLWIDTDAGVDDAQGDMYIQAYYDRYTR